MKHPAQSTLSYIKREQLKSQLFKEVSKALYSLLEDIDHQFQLTRVDFSVDKSTLCVFVYVPGGITVFEKKALFLKDLEGPLRGFIAKSLNKRRTPSVVFQYDQAFEKEQRLLSLLDEIKTSDTSS